VVDVGVVLGGRLVDPLVVPDLLAAATARHRIRSGTERQQSDECAACDRQRFIGAR
jgi:hypothetical protein